MKKLLAIMIAAIVVGLSAAPVRSMLGAREVEVTISDDEGGIPYITDGLIAMWDVLENDGEGLHQESSYTWVDLVGGIILESSTERVFSNSGVVGQFTVEVPPEIEDVFLGGEWTICALAGEEPTSTAGTDKTAMATINIGGYIYGCSFVYGYNRFLGCGTGTSPYTYLNGNKDCRNATITVRHGDDVGFGVYAYYNTKALAFNANSGNIPLSVRDKLLVGGSSPIRRVCIYNRRLTEEEIAYNYAIDKERFDL